MIFGGEIEMTRYFNTEGFCNPKEHYMVRMDDRIHQIKRLLIDRKKYFVINRGRQYGKTTTLKALEVFLKEEYIVLSLDFQKIGTEDFADAAAFVRAFVRIVHESFDVMKISGQETFLQPLKDLIDQAENRTLMELFVRLSEMCAKAPKPIILMIDEVDSASNNQVFVDFLAQLRGYYLRRDQTPIFQSVLLVSVYDIKNLKLKLRPDSEHQYNSPWNIAADFDIEMSFSVNQIAAMLEEYENDHCTGMDMQSISEEIYGYTSGYPYLVSAICKQMDEKIEGTDGFETLRQVWTKEGVSKAVKNLLKKNPPLFGHMVKQLDLYKDLRKMIEDIIYRGKRVPFSPEEKSINLGIMFGFLKEENDHVAIANRIFEMCLLNLFMAEEAGSDVFSKGDSDRIQFIKNGRLDMDLVLRKFVEYFHEIYGENDDKFIENYGRKFFLLYLKPIINGTGNYYIEAQTRDARRTDVIVDYLGEQFIVELKIWHGNEYNERGEEQLADYLEYYHKDKGYMLSFNFNKNKRIGVREIQLCDKTIVEAVV